MPYDLSSVTLIISTGQVQCIEGHGQENRNVWGSVVRSCKGFRPM